MPTFTPDIFRNGAVTAVETLRFDDHFMYRQRVRVCLFGSDNGIVAAYAGDMVFEAGSGDGFNLPNPKCKYVDPLARPIVYMDCKVETEPNETTKSGERVYALKLYVCFQHTVEVLILTCNAKKFTGQIDLKLTSQSKPANTEQTGCNNTN